VQGNELMAGIVADLIGCGAGAGVARRKLTFVISKIEGIF
jgi:hypothetical protein